MLTPAVKREHMKNMKDLCFIKTESNDNLHLILFAKQVLSILITLEREMNKEPFS